MPDAVGAADISFVPIGSCDRRASRPAVLAVLCLLTGVACANALGSGGMSGRDDGLARAAVLHAADFGSGSGWVSITPPSGGSSAAGGANGSCAAAANTSGLSQTGHAVSAFRAPGFYVQSWATVLATAGMVQVDWRRSSPYILGCLRDSIQQSLPTGTKLMSVGALAFPKVAPLLQAYRATVSVTAGGTAVPMIADMLIYARGRTELELLQVSPQSYAAQAKAAEQRIATLLSLRATA